MPRLGRKPVDKIATSDVLAVLVPIWNTKRETARRVRQRIRAVMRWAVAEGHREDDPAGDAIGATLPNADAHREHLRALPHGEVGAALRKEKNRTRGWRRSLPSSLVYLRQAGAAKYVARDGRRSKATPESFPEIV